ncbi:hypothetical protein B0O80DRAFT_531934 [Mortierella sp. GBAus27b]|nr:hypothetical protein BGX31_000565 [Mortierella sp. GBA43]KAI8349076.1 hypothetical protein B0O80DRAFT_531934 [Mortierella sp. GBAus27b]
MSSMSSHRAHGTMTIAATDKDSGPSPLARLQQHSRIKDPYDILPPELIDQILANLDQIGLLQCAMLSKRWFKHVVPHLWRAPFIRYFASWMKLYQTAGTTMPFRAVGFEGGERDGCCDASAETVNPELENHPGSTVGWHEKIRSCSRLQQSQPCPMGDQEEVLDDKRMSDRLARLSLSASQPQEGVHVEGEECCRKSGGQGGGGGKQACEGGQSEEKEPNNILVANHLDNVRDHNHVQMNGPCTALPTSYGTHIRVLDFARLYYIVSDKFLALLLPATPNLEQLVIDSPKQLSDASLVTLSLACPRLRHLELVACPRISDAGLHSVVTHCHHIHTLVLTNNRLSDQFLAELAASPTLSRTLRVLNLSNAGHSITEQNPGLASIAVSCPNLVHLDISRLSEAMVTDDFLGLLTCAPTLQVLNIAYCQEITDKGLTHIANSCPNLRDLDVSALNLITSKGIAEVKRRCPKLQRLAMSVTSLR